MTPEAKRRKNQKKKQKQKQKKQAEKLVVEPAEGPVVEQSQDDSVESAELSQSVDESDMNTTTTTAPLETENRDAVECKSSSENMEIIRSLQLDTGISIQGQLEKKLSKEVTIVDNIASESSEDVNIVEADHNVAVPADTGRETDLAIESAKGIENGSHPEVLSAFRSTDSSEPEADTARVESLATIAFNNDSKQETITMTDMAQDNGEKASIESFEGHQSIDDESTSQIVPKATEQVYEHEQSIETDQSVASSSIDQSQAQCEAENLAAETAVEHSTFAGNGADFSPDIRHNPVKTMEMFPDNDRQADEVLIFGAQHENMNSNTPSPSCDKQAVDLFMDDNENNEVMPWETSTVSENRDLESEKGMESVDTEGLETNDKTIESNERNGKENIEDEGVHVKKISTPALGEKSDEMTVNAEASLAGQEDDHLIETAEEKAFLQNGLNASGPAEKLEQPKQEQNGDRLAAIFGADDTADDNFWLNEHSQLDRTAEIPQPENRSSEQEEDKTKTKFSFLQEDDDLLDEEEDGFLTSDDEEPIAQTTKNESSGSLDAHSASHVVPIHEHPSPVEVADSTLSISSLSKNEGRSRYEPVQYSKAQDSAPPHAGRNVPSQYGIATPQFALQTNLPAQPQNLRGNQEVVEKINEEKKKSDAYDFPLDLFPEKKKIVHAKPVNVPNFTPGLSQQVSNGVTPGPVSQVDAGRSIGNRSAFDAPLPKNPYASLVKPQSKVAAGYQMPTQGIVPPIPVASSIAPTRSVQHTSPSTNSQYQAINSYMQTSRSRGYSNASAGSHSSKGIDRTVRDITPLPFPPASRKTSATKYAPVSPSQASHQYAYGKGNGTNGSSVNPPHFGGLQSMNPEVNLQSVPWGSVSTANTMTNPPPIPYGSLPSANTQPVQDFALPAVKVPDSLPPTNVLSPTSASSTRRFHARSNSSVYTPNQSEYTAKYAPTVHPQYQNTNPMPQEMVQNPNFPLMADRSTGAGPPINRQLPEASVFDKPVDNQALLRRQFPLMHWSASDRIVCAVPVETSPSSYIMGPGSCLQSLEVSQLDSKIPGTNLLKSFPGPLIKNKVKKKDVYKWLETSQADYADSSLEYTLLAILKLRLADNSTSWKDISRCLYDSDELLSYLSQPLLESKSKPVTPKLDGAAQLKVLAYLQTGGREMALAIAMEKRDYAMALLIGSLMGKDKWTEVVQTYLRNEFSVESNVSHFSTNLLSLMFQVFIGNSKTAVQELYTDSSKGQWATENWRIVVAAVLNNIEVTCEKSMNHAVPPMINEFLVEYGVFLAQKGLNVEASIVFVIANLPFSSSPIADTSVKFEHIGGPLSLEGCIFSEIYEFVNCSDAKGYGSLYSHKLYHAFFLHEHGLFSAASRYVDHLTSMLKQFPKKDPTTWQMARGLNELSSRLAGSSTGWLGKPTLSSVWGQLDKSFNKYIGGDDDSLIKKPQEKKVFDGFTPVNSRNSSMLNVSQYEFTPAHKQAQHSTFKPDQKVLLAALTANPVENPAQGLVNNNQLSKSLTDQGLPPMPPYSVASSPQQPESQGLHRTISPAHLPLRRVQTEQAGGTNTSDRHLVKTGTEIERKDTYAAKNGTAYYPGTTTAPSASLGRSSSYYCPTPDLLQSGSRTLSDALSPAEPQAAEVNVNKHPSEPLIVHSVQQSNQNESTKMAALEGAEHHKPFISDNEVPYKQKNYSQVSIADSQEMAEGQRASETLEPPVVAVEHMVDESSVNADQRTNNYQSDRKIDTAFSSASHKGVYNHSHASESVAGTVPESHVAGTGVSTFDSNENMGQSEQESLEETLGHRKSDVGFVAADRFNESSFNNKQETVERRQDEAGQTSKESSDSITDAPRPSNAGPEISISSPINRYAPLVTSKSYETHAAPFGGPAKTNGYIADDKVDKSEQISVKAVEKTPPVISSPAERSATSANRFDPIKPAEALTADIFEPVIKKSSASKAFAPLVVQSPEVQYDDMVEDESDDDDDEEERRRQLEQEKRKKEEEEKKRKEKEMTEAKKNKQKQDEKATGWFSWLKKDPNEKKPIKAKLGHKSTFYYDEKLKRWVNKDSSEAEKEKMASPPPPPPVIKRMDNGPKTKPLPSPETQLKDTAGAVVPENPITGAPLKSSSTASPATGDIPVAPSMANHSGVNLSGKKANGLDDLLSLTGNSGGTSKRKRKPGRGYVNVMDNK